MLGIMAATQAPGPMNSQWVPHAAKTNRRHACAFHQPLIVLFPYRVWIRLHHLWICSTERKDVEHHQSVALLPLRKADHSPDGRIIFNLCSR
jgi:hypothetical protein